MSPEDVINNALEAIGHPGRIGSFYDGSPEALAARDVWGGVRDALLIKVAPDWALRDMAVTVIKTAPIYGYDDVTPWTPAYPEMPWLYEYAQPEDCLSPISLRPRTHVLPVWRPKPMRFRAKVSADSMSNTLLGNDPDPILTCIARIPNTDLWYEDFVQMAVEALAQRLMPLFGNKTAMAQEKRDANNPG